MVMPQTRGYSAALDIYLDAGWPGVLPLPPGRKVAPPSGYTGHNGAWPDQATYDTWRRDNDGGNIALRLPRNVIGIDVDHYGPKTGADTLEQLERDRGPLPATWTSTSRGVGPSAIRFYRIPEGLELPGTPGPHIEFIQYHHRYAVVAPSVFEERRYRWRDPNGALSGLPPRADDFVDLPVGWHDWAAPTGNLDDVQRLLTQPEPARNIAHRSAAVNRALADGIAGMRTGTRHDTALKFALALLRLHNSGHPGALDALEDLGFVFRTAISDRATPIEADNEWRRILEGGATLVASTPATRPSWDQLGDPLAGIPTIATLAPASQPATAAPEAAQSDPDVEHGWEAVDLAAIASGAFKRPAPALLRRTT